MSASKTAWLASIASYLKQRDRINLAKWLVARAAERGLPVDPVAVVRAFQNGAPEPSATGTEGDGKQLPHGRPVRVTSPRDDGRTGRVVRHGGVSDASNGGPGP